MSNTTSWSGACRPLESPALGICRPLVAPPRSRCRGRRGRASGTQGATLAVAPGCAATLTCEAGQTGCVAAPTHPPRPLVSAHSHADAASLAQGGGNATLDNYMENENDAQISALLGKVNQLKQVSVQIGDHVREDNRLLGGMSDQFDTSGSMLGGTVKRLSALANSKDGWHMVYLAMFVVLVFLFIYKMTR